MEKRRCCFPMVLSLFFLPVFGEEGNRAKEPIQPETAEHWIKHLDSPQWELRDKAAQKLVEVGEDAAPALLEVLEREDSDPELKHRIERILYDRIGWMPDEVRPEVKRLSGVLKNTRNREEWNKAFEEWKGLGRPARKAFSDLIRPPREPKGELLVRELSRNGRAVGYEAVFRNTGDEGIWIETDRVIVMELLSPCFGQKRWIRTGGADPTMLSYMRRLLHPDKRGRVPYLGNADPLYSDPPLFLYVEPGEEAVLLKKECSRGFGDVEVSVFYTIDDVTREVQLATAAQVSPEDLQRTIEENRRWPVLEAPDIDLVSLPETIRILPPVYAKEEPPTVHGLQLWISSLQEEADGEKVTLELVWKNTGSGGIKIPSVSDGNTGGLWCAWLDEEKEWIVGGSPLAVGEKHPKTGSKDSKWISLASQKEMRARVFVEKPAESEKASWLVVGYRSREFPERLLSAHVELLFQYQRTKKGKADPRLRGQFRQRLKKDFIEKASRKGIVFEELPDGAWKGEVVSDAVKAGGGTKRESVIGSGEGGSGQNGKRVCLTAIAFDDTGMLYGADARNGRVIGMVMEDQKERGKLADVPDLGERLADAMGFPASRVAVHDVSVHPLSGKVYVLAGKKTPRPRGRWFPGDPGATRLFRVEPDGGLRDIALQVERFTSVDLPKGVFPLDLAISADGLIVSSMSEGEFPEGYLHSIHLPLNGRKTSTVATEVYMSCSGRWEKQAPLTSIAVHTVKGEAYLFGSSIGTPLVRISVDDISTENGKVKTDTIHELGMGNGPMSLVFFERWGKDPSLLISTMRGSSFLVARRVLEETDDKRLNENVEIPGLKMRVGGIGNGSKLMYLHDDLNRCMNLHSWDNVRKMALLDEDTMVVVRDRGDGGLSLSMEPLP